MEFGGCSDTVVIGGIPGDFTDTMRGCPLNAPDVGSRVKTPTAFDAGTSDPLIATYTPELETESWGGVIVDEETGETSKDRVYAAGDIVTGSATVIEAAGGIVTDLVGNDTILDTGDTLAAGGGFHPVLLEVTRAAFD